MFAPFSGATENVFKIHKQTPSTGEKSVMRNGVHSFSYSKLCGVFPVLSARYRCRHCAYLRGLTVDAG